MYLQQLCLLCFFLELLWLLSQWQVCWQHLTLPCLIPELLLLLARLQTCLQRLFLPHLVLLRLLQGQQVQAAASARQQAGPDLTAWQAAVSALSAVFCLAGYGDELQELTER